MRWDHQVEVNLVDVPGRGRTTGSGWLSIRRRHVCLDRVLELIAADAASAAKGVREPLGPALAGQAARPRSRTFYPQAMDLFAWKGTLTCSSQNLSPLVAPYNSYRFDFGAGLPRLTDDWTWDEILVCRPGALTRDTRGNWARPTKTKRGCRS